MKKTILTYFINEISKKYDDPKYNDLIKFNSNAVITKSMTNGFFAEIFTINNKSGIELWYDEFTNTGYPKLALTIWSTTKKDIELYLPLLGNYFLSKNNSRIKESNNNHVLMTPLPKKYFGNYIIEPYDDTFLTLYFPFEIKLKSPRIQNITAEVIDEVDFLFNLVKEVINETIETQIDFPYVENRILVRKHIIRERKAVINKLAKLRDNYTCKICDFKFFEKYGKLGLDFAEAHHIIPLNKSNSSIKNSANDLITVCSNCHRMLHRMKGEVGDINRLKKLVNKTIV